MTSASAIRRPRVGLVTLGQGPRPEFERLHADLFRILGLDVDFVSRHALDGLTASEITAIEATDTKPAIHSNIRGVGGFPSPLGADWSAKWISRERLVPLVQRCIDSLETEEQVDVTICCVAEAFPPGSFSSRKPFILPALAMLAQAEILASTKPNAVIGLVVHGTRQRAQQKEGWLKLEWAQRLNLHFAGDDGLDAAVEELHRVKPDLVLVWAYAAGFGPKDPDGRLADLAAALGAPMIVPAVAATITARNFLGPPLTGKRRTEQTRPD